MTSINFEVIGLTGIGFEPAWSGSADLPNRETDTLRIQLVRYQDEYRLCSSRILALDDVTYLVEVLRVPRKQYIRQEQMLY